MLAFLDRSGCYQICSWYLRCSTLEQGALIIFELKICHLRIRVFGFNGGWEKEFRVNRNFVFGIRGVLLVDEPAVGFIQVGNAFKSGTKRFSSLHFLLRGLRLIVLATLIDKFSYKIQFNTIHQNIDPS